MVAVLLCGRKGEMPTRKAHGPFHVVWFKRDLRVYDNAALNSAAAQGAVIPLYVAEPELWNEPDSAGRHWDFIAESLVELRDDLARLGTPLVVRLGDVIKVLSDLNDRHGICALWSHEETGNGWTYARDKRVKAWCAQQNIPWHEARQNGVIRRLKDRDGWAKAWDQFMTLHLATPPPLSPLPNNIEPGIIPASLELGLKDDACPDRQKGGRSAAQSTLLSFLNERGIDYRRAMSSPVTGEWRCSRLSPHLAFGTVSLREVTHATWSRMRDLKAVSSPDAKRWRASLSSFSGRLHWHCHFMQKLESEPRIEFENFHPAYDNLRPAEPNRAFLNAWANGQTGFPFVDACMRALSATGWMNFRMRAMLMAFASYHLWLPWRDSGLVLARLFTDYEPGIHWSQTQMQSGTTGINTIRIYNPVKQGYDQDPDGQFIRRWVPELREVPDHILHEPWTWEGAPKLIGKTYPERLVDHISAAREASQKVWGVRKDLSYKSRADTIQEKHGSRKSGLPSTTARKRKKSVSAAQLRLDLG